MLRLLKVRFIWMLLSGLIAAGSSSISIADEEIAWLASGEDGSPRVQLYFFWSPTCPHCQNARAFIDPLPRQYPWIDLHSYNVIENRDHLRRFESLAMSMGQDAQSVPAMFICGQMFTGWDHPGGMGRILLELAEQCRTGNTQQPVETASLNVPWLGEVVATDYSLPLFTVIIAGLDAFNPCAFFVLLFLLSLLVHARSRLRMLLIGGTFVLVSGAVYFVFMAAWLNLFLIVGGLKWVTLIAGLVAITIGLFGVKDFFMFLKGPTFSISDKHKPQLYERMRKLLSVDSMPTLMVSTFILALVANSYELLCTAGFPMVYTRTLTLHQLDEMSYYLYLVLYNVVYVIPLAVIVLVFTVSLGARKLTANEGRLLKLLSGLMMLGLGVVLLLDPGLLNNMLTGAGLLLAAFVITWVASKALNNSALKS
ncbi:MAG: hypothetical protein OQL16_13035 [Gammaproteobacteria bacterium]|nr:hypothetical protein [Gammaproteobacteria bacterium]